MVYQSPRAQAPYRHEFRAHPRGPIVLALVSSVVPAALCLVLGTTIGVAAGVWIASAAVVVATVWTLSSWIVRHYDQPLASLIEVTNTVRLGQQGRRLPEGGSPAVRTLARMLNEAWASIDERTRLSQANLLSVEAQFERIHSVLRSLVEGVVVVDLRGDVILANPAARQMVEGEGRPIEGRSLASLVSGELKESIIASLAQMHEPTRSRSDVYGIHVGAKVFDVSVVRVYSESSDQDFGSVVVFHDVSRNHEIARLKDEFLSSVSHELRTPLTNICAFSEILTQVTPEDRDHWQEFLRIITEETRRLKKLVDDVLDYSGLEAGRVVLQAEEVDLGALVRTAVDQIMPLAEQRHETIEVLAPIGNSKARGDHERLHQVMLRLLDNAIKFTPEGGKVRVSVAAVSDQVQVSVEDSGRGIPVDQREAVFDKFHQIGNTLTDKPTGQGLSLAICRRVLGVLGGIIWCEESELGGTSFRFLIPAAGRAQTCQAPLEVVANQPVAQ